MCTGSHTIFYTRPIRQNMKKKMTTKQNTLHPLIRAKVLLNFPNCCHQNTFLDDRVMRESAFYVCENKDPDQLSGSRIADQHFSFCDIDTNIRNSKPEAIFYVCTALSVSVLVGPLEHRFSRDAAQNMFDKTR